MRFLFLILFFLSGCTTIQTPLEKSEGTMYHYSANQYYQCSLCNEKTNLFRLDRNNKVVCNECFKKSNKKYLYH